MGVVELRVSVLDPALDPHAPMWGDASGEWQSPGLAWFGVLTAAGVPTNAGDEGRGLLVVPEPDRYPAALEQAQHDGRPFVVTPPPSDPADALTVIRDALGALVRPDLRGIILLRLDDPGASVRRHLRSWVHDDLPPETWEALWQELEGFGRASVFCCPGWVTDDGNVVSSRVASPLEWQALDHAVEAGLADLECHGHTHLYPDLEAWVGAADRFENETWYRELWPPRDEIEPSEDAQAEVLAAWQAACGRGTTLVAPGEAWGLNTVAAARRRGLALFTSWGICRLDLPVPTWSVGIGSPYLDQADPRWLEAGLPVVGYWHDRDMAVHGPGWVGEQLAAWRDCGARKAWAFADLARTYSTPIDAALVEGEVVVQRQPAAPVLVERAQ